MKKILGSLGVVVLVAAGVGPVITGNMAETEMKALVAAVNAEPQTTLTIESYEKGFFTAQAVLSLKLLTGVPELDAKTFSLDVSVEHGPILFSQGTLGLTAISMHLPSDAVGLQEFSEEENIASYSAVYGFTGKLNHHLQFSALAVEGPSSMSFSGFDGAFTTDANLTALKGDFNIGEVQIQSTDAMTDAVTKVLVEPSKIAFDWTPVAGNESLVTGSSEWTLPKAIVNSGMFNVELNQLSIDAKSQVSEENITVSQSLKIASVTGPMPLESFSYDISFSNIQLATYDAFVALTDAMQNMQQTGVELTEEQMTELMKPMFQKGIKNTQHFSVKMGGGHVKADFDAEFVGDANTINALMTQDDQALLSSVEGQLSVVADSSAVMTTPLALMIPSWVQQGLMTKQGDTFTFNADVKKAMLNLNGQAMPLQTFLSPEPPVESEAEI